MAKKKIKKGYKRAAGIIALLLCFSLFGCSKKTAGESEQSSDAVSVSEEIVEVKPSVHIDYPSGDRSPLEIERDYSENEEGYVLYPKVISGAYADKINNEICAQIQDYAEKQQRQIFTEYRIEMNSEGLFSIMIFIRDLQSNELLFQLPMTFDTASGELCDISYFFDPNDSGWRSAAAGLAEKNAEQNGIDLLNGVPEINDGQSYYLTDQSLVLQYGIYEVSTYSAGWPEFELSVDELRPYLAQNSPLLRVLD